MPTLVRRRALLGLGAAFAATLAGRPALALGLPPDGARRAALTNLHTGDRFDDVYFENGRYLTDALAEACKVLRDWRTGETCAMDPVLFDALHAVRGKLETKAPFQIISGYRSPKTNAMLHARSKGVASQSQHTLGKAVDVRLERVELSSLRKAALAVGAGGVGYYPVSGFVHLDTGRVRQWSGA